MHQETQLTFPQPNFKRRLDSVYASLRARRSPSPPPTCSASNTQMASAHDAFPAKHQTNARACQPSIKPTHCNSKDPRTQHFSQASDKRIVAHQMDERPTAHGRRSGGIQGERKRERLEIGTDKGKEKVRERERARIAVAYVDFRSRIFENASAVGTQLLSFRHAALLPRAWVPAAGPPRRRLLFVAWRQAEGQACPRAREHPSTHRPLPPSRSRRIAADRQARHRAKQRHVSAHRPQAPSRSRRLAAGTQISQHRFCWQHAASHEAASRVKRSDGGVGWVGRHG